MCGIPYVMDVLDLVNEAHLRPWPKTYVRLTGYIYSTVVSKCEQKLSKIWVI